MTIVATVVGLLIILVTLRDIVHELFDPEDVGSMSRYVMHGSWRVIQRLAGMRESFVYHAGHMILLVVAVLWTALLMVGFALVYWPRLPGGFHVDSALPPSAGRGFVTALYVSLAALTTLGSNDIVPLTSFLRLTAAVESLVGAGMITAWISWVLSIYPVLATRRAFEREVCLLQQLEPDVDRVVRERPVEAVAELLRSLTGQVLRVAAELSQSRVTYYFQNRTRDISLARQLPYVLDLGRAAERVGQETVSHRGLVLRRAVETTLQDIAALFLDVSEDASPETIVAALEKDHMLSNTGG